MQSGAVSALIYFTSLVISLAIAATDDKISLQRSQPSLWETVKTVIQFFEIIS